MLGQAAVERMRNGGLFAVSGGYHRVSNDPQVDSGAPAGQHRAPARRSAAGLRRLRQHHQPALDAGGVDGARRRARGCTSAISSGSAGSVSGASVTNKAIFQPTFGELVDGRPARVWDIRSKGVESQWALHRRERLRRRSLGAVAEGDAEPGRALRLRLGLGRGRRQRHQRGPACCRAATLRWTPRGDNSPLAVTAGYSWYRNRLPLEYLAVGDPQGPTGVVSRWDDRNGDLQFTDGRADAGGAGRLVLRGRERRASVIDPGLRRAVSSRSSSSAPSTSSGAWRMRMTGVDRREHNAAALVNTGIPLARVPGRSTCRTPASTSTAAPPCRRCGSTAARRRCSGAIATRSPTPTVSRRSTRAWTSRWTASSERRYFFRFGGSAYRIKSTGMNRGFLSNENDQGGLGEAFLTPNALTSGDGRSFFDRAFVIKLSGGYRAPGDVRIGMVARYQDGLPFSRMVLTDAFHQGRDLVMAIPRGAQRFTYMFTLDAKVEKDLTFGPAARGLDLRGLQPDQRHDRGRGIRGDRAGLPHRVGGAAAAGAARRPAGGILMANVYDFEAATLRGVTAAAGRLPRQDAAHRQRRERLRLHAAVRRPRGAVPQVPGPRLRRARVSLQPVRRRRSRDRQTTSRPSAARRYDVTFPLFAKIDVNGAQRASAVRAPQERAARRARHQGRSSGTSPSSS